MAEAELSLRDQLIAVRDEIVERESPEVEAAPVPEAPPSTEEPAGGRPRDEQGRFASDKDTASAVAEPPSSSLSKESVGAAAAEAAPKEPEVAPPNSWSAAERALWGKLPKEAQQTIARREADVHKALTKQDEERALAREFTRISQPYEPVLRAVNSTPLQALETFLNVAYTLRTGTPEQKLHLIANAARQNGVDLSALAQAQSSGQQFPQLPPDVVAELQESRRFREEQLAQKQTQEAERQRQILSYVQEFRSDPAHPHFDAVYDVMVGLLNAESAKDLKDAYEQAVWASPAIRSQLTQAQQSDKAKADKAQRAKLKAVSVRGGPGGSVPVPQDRSLRQELEANFAESAGRL